MSDCTVPGCDWQNLSREYSEAEEERELNEHIWHSHGGFGD